MHDVLQNALEFMRSLMYQNKILGGSGDGCVEVHPNTEVDGRQCMRLLILFHKCPLEQLVWCMSPSPPPPVENAWTMMIVWRIRGKVTRTVLCCIVYNSCSHIHEQFLRFTVGLGFL